MQMRELLDSRAKRNACPTPKDLTTNSAFLGSSAPSPETSEEKVREPRNRLSLLMTGNGYSLKGETNEERKSLQNYFYYRSQG